jgi:hypothetical protein
LGVGVGGKDIKTEHHIGLAELGGGPEALAINFDRREHLIRRKVRGKGVGQAK